MASRPDAGIKRTICRKQLHEIVPLAFQDAEHFAELAKIILPCLTTIRRGALMFVVDMAMLMLDGIMFMFVMFGRLASAERAQGQGVGELLLADAFWRILGQNRPSPPTPSSSMPRTTEPSRSTGVMGFNPFGHGPNSCSF